MNYATVIQALKPLNELRKLKLPYIKAKEVYRISKLFEGEFAFFQQEENKLIGEYATKDDKGNPKTENGVICYGLLACLDGLKQLGANGNVTDAYNKLEKHINNQAHE